MKESEDEYSDFSTVNYKAYEKERKTPVKRYANILAITFCIIGFFILLTAMIILFKAPFFLLQFAEMVIFASLPFISFNEEVIGIIPTSVLFLLLSFFLFLLKDEKRFTFIQCAIAVVSVIAFLYYILSI